MAGYTEEEYEQSQYATPNDPPKGPAEWAEQNSGDNAPGLKPTPNPASGTLEAHERQQTDTPTIGGVSATPALSPEQQKRVDATAGTDRQIKTIQDWMNAEENRPETSEERKKRERREKSKRIISAVSDGISALSNLYFTSQYAPNMYNYEKGSMTTAVGKRLDQLKAEREKKREQYMNFSMKLGGLENERAKTLRELEAQQEQQKLAREKAQREAEEHGWAAALQSDKQREQAGKANKAEQDAITAKAVAEATPELQQAKIDTERARKDSLDASASNSRASAAAHGRSNVSEFQGLGKDGKLRPFRTRQAAIDYERRQGTYDAARWGDDLEEVVETTQTNSKEKTTRKSKKKPVKGKGYGDDNKGY